MTLRCSRRKGCCWGGYSCVVVVVEVLVVSSSCCCISCSGCGSGWSTPALVPHVCDGRCSDEGGRVLDGEVQAEHGAARGKHRDILGLEGEVCSGGALGPGEEEELLEEKELLELEPRPSWGARGGVGAAPGPAYAW